MARIGSIEVSVIATVDKFLSNMHRARGATTLFGKSAAILHRQLLGLGSVLAAGVSIRKLGQVAEEIDKIAKSGDTLGIATENLVGFGRAAELAGASQSALANGLSRMERNLATSHKAFEQLNLDAQILQRLSPDVAFGKIADAMKGISDNGSRLQIVRDLFGKQGEQLLPLMLGGSEEMRRHQAIAGGFSRSGAAGVESMNDALTSTGHAFTNLLSAAVLRFGGSLAHAMDRMTSALGGARFNETTMWTERLNKLSDSQFASFRTAYNRTGSTAKSDATRRFFGTSSIGFENEIGASIRERELRMLGEHQERVARLTPTAKAGGFPFAGLIGMGMQMGLQALQASEDAQRRFESQISPSMMHRIQTRVQEMGLDIGRTGESTKRRGMGEVRSLAALEKGSAAAFSQEHRSRQVGQQLDVAKKQLQTEQKMEQSLQRMDTNLIQALNFSKAANLG